MNLLQSTARRTAEIFGRQSWLVRRMRPAYESILDWSSKGQGIPWTINGVTYLIDPHHRHRLGQNYDPTVAAFLRERIKPGAVCLDVGANVGVYVLQFAHWSGPTGRVIAFEPNPGAREILEKHIRFNKLNERVQVIPFAVGASRGQEVLYAADADGMSRLGVPNQAIANQVSEVAVPVTTLDSFCFEEGVSPDWLLIDIEGFEIQALIGASELIKSRKGAMGIIVEMHPNVWESANTSRSIVESTLASLRLRPVPLTGQNDPLGDHGLVYLTYE